MVRRSLGKSERSDWFLVGRDFAPQTVPTETFLGHVHRCLARNASVSCIVTVVIYFILSLFF